MIGGAVKGGLYGSFPTQQFAGPDDCGNNGQWIPTISVEQYGAALASWFGASTTERNTPKKMMKQPLLYYRLIRALRRLPEGCGADELGLGHRWQGLQSFGI